jgi:UbiD family decarboxylase
MNRLRDLRAYLSALSSFGDLHTIDTEVDWNLEVGAVIRRSYELRAAAPLFRNLPRSARGFRILGAPGALSSDPLHPLARVAISLGLEPHASGTEIVEVIAAALDKPGLPPVEVAGAPCKENTLIGGEVDLELLPVPLIHGGDGGRYLNTYGLNIVRTPDGRWTNWSINRMMLQDRNHLTGTFAVNQHLGMILSEWRDRGEDMPIAIALGVEPALPFLAGGMPLPEEISEADFVGAYFGEPLELVQCETLDLLVPASAEIVIEGRVSIQDRVPEGPMSEYPGYQVPGANTAKPLITVTAMTWRNDAILPVVAAGPPVEEDHTAWGIPHAAQTLHDLRADHLPVTGCWLPLESANHWMVVALDSGWRELDRFTHYTPTQMATRIGRLVFETKSGMDVPNLLVVDDDIDITDTAQVVWAFATRCHPISGAIPMEREEMMILPIMLDADEKHQNYTTKAVFNCLYQQGWNREKGPIPATFALGWPDVIRQRVLARWREYGYPDTTPTTPTQAPRQ